MARKRRPVDPALGERLFGDRLKRYLGQLPALATPGLDPLLGENEWDEPEEAAGATALSRLERWRLLYQTPNNRTRTAVVDPRRRSIYLSARDLEDADFVADRWAEAWHRNVSRSEVIRQAIRNLRGSLDTMNSGI